MLKTRSVEQYPNSIKILKLLLNTSSFTIFLSSTNSGKTFVYVYIYCHPQTDCFVLSGLFSVARQVRFPKLGSKPGCLKRQSKILPLSHEETSESEGNLNAYVSHLFLFTYIRLTATESSIHLESLVLR